MKCYNKGGGGTMIKLLIEKNMYENLDQYSKVEFKQTTMTGIDESHPIVFRIPDGTFYGSVTEDRLQDVISGHADDLKIQTARYFSVEMKTYISEPMYRKTVKHFLKQLKKMEQFDKDAIKREMKDCIKENHIVEYQLYNPLKMALIGTTLGPKLPDLMSTFGKDECVVRIKKYLRNYRYRF